MLPAQVGGDLEGRPGARRTWIDGKKCARGLLRIARRDTQVVVDRDQHALWIKYAAGLGLEQEFRVRSERAASMKTGDLPNAVGPVQTPHDHPGSELDLRQRVLRLSLRAGAEPSDESGSAMSGPARASRRSHDFRPIAYRGP
jgi:hypothetical protein